MLQFPKDLRKRRTRQHVIADQSMNHVERFIIDEGYIPHRVTADYGYDLIMTTFDEQGYTEPGVVFLQLKASDALTTNGENYAYDLDIRDYNLWRFESQPVLIVLYDAIKRRAYWLHVQSFFETASRRPRKGAKTVRVLVPKRQVFNGTAVARIRVMKNVLLLKVATEEFQ